MLLIGYIVLQRACLNFNLALRDSCLPLRMRYIHVSSTFMSTAAMGDTQKKLDIIFSWNTSPDQHVCIIQLA